MDIFFDRVKDLFWIMITALASIVAPVKDILIALFLAFVFNIIIGIATDIHVNRAKFNIKKAFNAITQLAFYAMCVIFLDIFTLRVNEPTLGLTAAKWLTIIVAYFYATNTFKNAKELWPKSKAIRFIYELLSTEIFDRIKNAVGYKTPEND